MSNKFQGFFIFLFLTFAPFGNNFGQSQTVAFSHGGATRNCIVYLPQGYNTSLSYPLVFNLHGLTSNAAQQQLYSKMNIIADQYKFIVAYPNGINNSWNSGFVGAYGSGVDDVGFVSDLIDTISAMFNVNPQRVYTCGMSNGGFQSYRMACELSHRIAAMASVTGVLSDSTAFYCNPTRKMPVMQVHGTNDATVPYTGLPGLSLSVDGTVNFWINLLGCSTTAIETDLPNTNLTDLSTVTTYRYNNCPGGNEVLFYKVTNGGHTWPGAAIDIPGVVTNRDIDASLEIWKFFEKFTLSGPVGIENSTPLQSIQLTPNPATDFITFETKEPAKEISIYDMSGRKIADFTINNLTNQSITLPVSQLCPGNYILAIKTTQGRSFSKFIKN